MVRALRAHRSGPRVSAIVGSEGPLVEALEGAGAAVHTLPLPAELQELGESGARRPGELLRLVGQVATASARAVGFARRLAAQVAAERPDVLHSNGMKMHALLPLLGGRARRVIHLHDFLSERPVMPRLLRTARFRLDAVIAVSRAVGEDARDALGLEELDVIHNAVDLEAFCPGAAPPGYLERLAGRPAEGPAVRVGLVATWARWKGHLLFLEACADLLRLHPDLPLRFFLVGGPLYQTAGSQLGAGELAAHAAQLGLGERLFLVPFQQAMPEVYRALDVVVHASTRPEPFGMTIAEAMACGRAAVVAAAGGARELFTDGLDAVGYPSGKRDALALAISRLLANRRTREELAAAARRTAEERFSRERQGEQLVAVYRRIAAAAR